MHLPHTGRFTKSVNKFLATGFLLKERLLQHSIVSSGVHQI